MQVVQGPRARTYEPKLALICMLVDPTWLLKRFFYCAQHLVMDLHEALHNVCKYACFLVFVELLIIKTQCTVVPLVIQSPLWVVMVAQVSMVGKGRALATSRAPKSTILLHF